VEKLAAREAASQPMVKKRKERSDKGKARARKLAMHGNEQDVEGEGDGIALRRPPRKKQKSAMASNAGATRKLPPVLKSNPMINSDEDKKSLEADND
jgi:hypothetical protein